MVEVTEQHTLDNNIPSKDFFLINADDNEQKQQVARQQWIADYDKYAKNYRACRYIESFSGREVDGRNDNPSQAAINTFIEWYDSACQVDKELRMA